MGTSHCVEEIELKKLVGHPDNPNRQSKETFRKLVRHIERTGRYEPLVVRRHPEQEGYYQVINGHHRCAALRELGHERAECVVWDVDDEETDILLSTLNRLGGSDVVEKRLSVLKRLSERLGSGELSKLLPQTKGQIERLTHLKMPAGPAGGGGKVFANAVVFFLDDGQQGILEKALAAAERGDGGTKAARRAAAITDIARSFLEKSI